MTDKVELTYDQVDAISNIAAVIFARHAETAAKEINEAVHMMRKGGDPALADTKVNATFDLTLWFTYGGRVKGPRVAKYEYMCNEDGTCTPVPKP